MVIGKKVVLMCIACQVTGLTTDQVILPSPTWSMSSVSRGEDTITTVRLTTAMNLVVLAWFLLTVSCQTFVTRGEQKIITTDVIRF